MNYNLYGLNHRDFQHLIQALARKVIAAGVSALGDGPDGARDLYYEGRAVYPNVSHGWNGYIVVGCKFKTARETTGEDNRWALTQLAGDLKKFENKRRKLRIPQYYIFATNVSLTSLPSSGGGQKPKRAGGRAKAEKALADFTEKHRLKGYAIWDGNDIRTFLDNNADVRTAYGNFITTGDILKQIYTTITGGESSIEVIHTVLQKELIADMNAKLQSAGDDPDVQISLSNVFVDLPCAKSSDELTAQLAYEGESEIMIVDALRKAAGHVCRPSDEPSEIDQLPLVSEQEVLSRFVIVGGPGQGKSTVGQYLAQCYRAAILKDRPGNRLDSKAKTAIRQLDEASGGLPKARRYPVRIELHRFSGALFQKPELTLFEYVRSSINRLGSGDVSKTTLRRWLGQFPWLVVLDGLDEVPPSSNRKEVMAQINDFVVECAAANADVLYIVTTRPQSYTNEFSVSEWHHYYLKPLTPEHALAYGRRLAEARAGADDQRRDDLIQALGAACQNESTAPLMQSPLQVTIMATLLENLGEPPQQRYTLFREYYDTTYKRETKRQLLGGILSKRRLDIDQIHRIAGFLLHSAGEISNTKQSRSQHVTDPALTDRQFRDLVLDRLLSIGEDRQAACDLVSTICDGSFQRLVFLVRPNDEVVKFDIASLKEFMAAEYLVDDDDSIVVSRLRAIAPASYWRNVFLFAFGKCLIQRSYLTDVLIALCADMNRPDEGTAIFADARVAAAASLTGLGSMLAIELIHEGTVRSNPNVERKLVRIAVENLVPITINTARDLALTYRDVYQREFEESINRHLKNEHVASQAGALRLLIALSERGVEWTRKLLESKWPSIPEIQERVLSSNSYPPWHGQGVLTRVLASVPQWGTKAVERFLRRSGLARFDDGSWQAFNRWQHQPGFRVRINPETPLSASIVSSRASGHKSRLLTDAISDIGADLGEGWAPLLAGGRFAQEPTAARLAMELEWLAGKFDGGWNVDAWALPWPLASCLEHARSAEQLQALAGNVRSAMLGGTTEWQAAEDRWRSVGLSDKDFHVAVEESVPFGRSIGEAGFPFNVARNFWQRDTRRERALGAQLKWIKSLPRGCARSWAASAALAAAFRVVKGTEVAKYASENVELLSLIDPSFRFAVTVDISSIAAALSADPGNGNLVELLKALDHTTIVRRLHRESLDTEPIVRHLVVNPTNNSRLYGVLAELVSQGARCVIPKQTLRTGISFGGAIRHRAYLLLLSQDDATAEEIEECIGEFMSYDGGKRAYLFGRALRITSHLSDHKGMEIEQRILRAVTPTLLQSEWGGIETYEAVIDNLIARLKQRSSLLVSPGLWTELKLPKRPADIQ